MLGERRGHRERADRDRLACLDLDDVSEAPLAHERPEAPWDDDRRDPTEPLERRDVEVVVVGMRDEDRVDAAKSRRVDPAAPAPEMAHPRPQDRVGQQTDAVERDLHGRVTDVRDLVAMREDNHAGGAESRAACAA